MRPGEKLTTKLSLRQFYTVLACYSHLAEFQLITNYRVNPRNGGCPPSGGVLPMVCYKTKPERVVCEHHTEMQTKNFG